MKFEALSAGRKQKYEIPPLSGGINTYSKAPFVEENQLSEAQNVWFTDGNLCSRKGVTPIAAGIRDAGKYLKALKGITVTDAAVNSYYGRCRIAYCIMGDNSSHEKICIYLMNEEGQLFDIAGFLFSRISSDIFHRVIGMSFVVGEKTRSTGIYLFMTRHCVNAGYTSVVYELSEDYTQWYQLSEEDFYVPTVYMNGMGNNYEQAEEWGVIFDKPTCPEDYNMLTGRFKAYFSSDEFSDTFVLPAGKLRADSKVECRLYYNQNSYSYWVINPNEDTAVSKVYSADITLKCDRENGTVTFLDAENHIFPVPHMKNAKKNNIVVTACKDTDYKDRVISSVGAIAYNGNVYLYGNDVSKNEIFASRLSNPLYFAENMKTKVGYSGEKVVAMAVQQNKLIAFKEKEIYKINVSEQSDKSVYNLCGSSYNFLRGDRLSTTPIHLSIGCSAPDSIALCGNKLVWLGNGGRVYTMLSTTYGKENNVYDVSLPIKKELLADGDLALKTAVAAVWEGYYLLFVGHKCYLFDYKIKKFGISSTFTGLKDTDSGISWYIWQFPSCLTASAVCWGKELTVCWVERIEGKCVFTSTLSGNKDTVAFLDGTTKNFSISFSFSPAYIYLCDMEALKNIDTIYLECNNSSRVCLELYDGAKTLTSLIEPSKGMRIAKVSPHLRAVPSLKLRFSSDGELSMGRITVYYHKISNVR